MMNEEINDLKTAQAFASSWNQLPSGSVYTLEQVSDWFAPIPLDSLSGKTVLELGCGNGSLFVHVLGYHPKQADAVDLGDSVLSAKKNASMVVGVKNWNIIQHDLLSFKSDGYDLVYSIGVLHHLKNPRGGFEAVLRNVKAGGRFHCWVYAREGNFVVRAFVEPLRKLCCRLPWWLTKYGVATPLALVVFFYAKLIKILGKLASSLPLAEYMKWIEKREFAFFRHVVFDQLVTPQTTYIDKKTILQWLGADPKIVDTYAIFRNGNSWKFGGRIRE